MRREREVASYKAAGGSGDFMGSIVSIESKIDHTTMIIPLPVCSAKLSIFRRR